MRATETADILRAKTGALLDFLEDYYRLSTPPVRDIRDYKDFVLRQEELPPVPGVQVHPGAEMWLSSALVALPEAPAIPAPLGQSVPEASLSPLEAPVLDDPEGPLQVVLQRWIESVWDPWSQAWKTAQTAREFYKSLYSLRSRVERDRDGVELVWGFGRLRWSTPEGPVDHPLVTVPVELVLADSGRLEVSPTGLPQIEVAFLSEVELAGRADLIALRQENRADDIELWDPDSRGSLLRELMRFIDHDAVFGPLPAPGAPAAHLADDWVLYVRRRQADYVGFLDAQRQILRNGGDLSLPFRSLVASEPSALGLDAGSGEDVERDGQDQTLYLPKPANEEQHRILRLAQERQGVTAQGPPGTGKSHTIANLICHFVANGQRVLVTAEKEQALAVLTSKLPTAVRELTVAVLGSDQTARIRLEHAINNVQERVSSFDAAYLDAEIVRFSQTIARVDAETAVATSQLREARTSEATPVLGTWEVGVDPTPSEAAAWLSDTQDELGFIEDRLAVAQPLPVEATEWEQFCQLLRDLDPPDISASTATRPAFTLLPAGATAAQRQELLGTLRSRLAGVEATISDWTRIDAAGHEAVAAAIDAVRGAADWLRKISGTWVDVVRVESSDPLTRMEWVEFVSAATRLREGCLSHRRALAAYSVVVPKAALPEVRAGLVEAQERLSAGRGVNKLVHRTAAKALASCAVDGRAPATADQVALCLSALSLDEQRQRLGTLWSNTTGRVGGPELSADRTTEDAVGEHCPAIEAALDWSAGAWPAKAESLVSLGLRPPADPTVEDLDGLCEVLETAALRAQERTVSTEIDDLCSYLKTGAEQFPSPLWKQLLNTFRLGHWDQWDQARGEVQRLDALKPRAERLVSLGDRIAAVAPRFAAEVTSTRAASAPDYARLSRAWQWRQLDLRVADIIGGPSSSDLQRQLEDLASTRLRVMEDLVAVRAWAGLAGSFDDRKRRALNKYLTAVKRYGKTGGKYKARWLREIREALDESKEAVPVWVMPTSRVLGSFRPEPTPPFDVLIIDEASQIGLLGIPVLTLARKAIVVGDDQQTSPENVGLDRQPVFNLIEDHLGGINGARMLFDPDNSLYDLSRQQFPDVVALREHFRCLPQIIAFSNGRYYQDRMIPLRDRPPRPGWQQVGSVLVEGGVRDGRDVNEAEAQAVVDLIARFCQSPEYDGMSFGVITLLSGGQAHRIQDLLLDRLGPETLEQRRIRCGDPALFQGDERDVMVLSTVVDGLDGRRIGAMTDKKAERRLNVAASRARNQMWVVHSVGASDFPVGDPRGELIRHCENPIAPDLLIGDVEQRCESQFERDVVRAIVGRGYRRVKTQWEVGRYRIDIVVEGQDHRLAIECDGDAWHGPAQWDEDRARQQKLERAGWTFHRIRGSAFYRHRDDALTSLWARLNELGIATGTWEEAARPALRVGPAAGRRSSESDVPRDAEPSPPTWNGSTSSGRSDSDGDAASAPRSHDDAPDLWPGSLVDVATDDPWMPSHPVEVGPHPGVEAAESVAGEGFARVPGDAAVDTIRFGADISLRGDPRLRQELTAAEILLPYRAWSADGVGAEVETNPGRVLAELVAILGFEGPMYALRLYQLHAKWSGHQRVGREMRSLYNHVVSRALVKGQIAAVSDGLEGIIHKTLYAPGTPSVMVRTLGPRQLQEVPRAEIKTLAAKLESSGEPVTGMKRTVLSILGLTRLTPNVSEYLDSCAQYIWTVRDAGGDQDVEIAASRTYPNGW